MVDEPQTGLSEDDRPEPSESGVSVPPHVMAAEPAGPFQLPLRGWWNAGWRVKDRVVDDNLALVAAGVAFYGLLALFPALATAVSVYGLVADRRDVAKAAEAMRGVVPNDVQQMILEQLAAITDGDQGALSVGALVAFGVSVWSANKGTKALFTGLNIAYREREDRNVILLNLFSLLGTLITVIAIGFGVGVLAMLPTLQGWGGTAVRGVHWGMLTVGMLGFITALYRYGPSRRHAKWRWLSLGAIIATVLWTVGSVLFSIYVEAFGSYNETFGTLGGVVITLTWIWMSAFVILFGAEINAELEHETLRDSTVGETRPLGNRGAFVADDVPESAIDRVHRRTRGET